MTEPNPKELSRTVDLTQVPQTGKSTADGKGAADSVVESRETVSYHAAGAKAVELLGKERAAHPKIPGYEIESVLGRGAMGVVYRAGHQKLKRTVALKMILAGAHAGESELARFRSESEAVARLQHPNIVGIYEVGEQDGLPYCALEFVEGGSLAQKFNRRPQPPEEAVRIVGALAEAMHLAHSRNVIHRDLKPANILLTSDGVPKISDFGLARQVDVESGQTQTGAVLGTPAYMAPEQASGQAHVAGPAADVYALGAILYEALTGRPPFAGKSMLQILELVRTVDPIPPRRLQPRLSRDLETICLKCLNKEPEKRYASALELAEDLRRYRAGEPIRARSTTMAERLVKWGRRRPAVAALISLLVFLSAVGLVAVLSQWVRAEVNASAERRQKEKAQRAQEDAEAAQSVAETATATAKKAQSDAEVNERKANDAKEKEKEAATKAIAAKLLSDRNAAIQSLAAARFALDENDLLRADEALESCPPGQRGWAWRHLKYRRQADLTPLTLNCANASRLAFNSNGRLIAFASTGRGIVLWDLVLSRETLVLPVGESVVHELAFSPDGKYLAAAFGAAGDGVGWVTVWNVADGKQKLELKGHTASVNGLTYSLDGKRLATASSDKTVKLWDLTDGTELLTLTGHTEKVLSVAYSPNGRNIVSGSADRTARIWDAMTGNVLQVNNRPGGAVTSVAFSPVAVSHGDWDYAAGDSAGLVTSRAAEPLRAHTNSITRVAYSPDGRLLITSGADRTVRVWDLENSVETFRLRGHTESVGDVALSPDGQLMVTASDDRTVKVWDAWVGESARMLASNPWAVLCAAYRADSRAVAIGTKDAAVAVLEPHSGVVIFSMRGAHEGPVVSVSFSSDGALLATGGYDGQMKVWDAASGKLKYVRRLAELGHTIVAFSPTEPLLATTDLNSLRLWDPEKGEVKRTIVNERMGLALAFSPDGKYLAIERELRLSVIEVATEKNVLNVAGLEMPVQSIAWHPNSRHVAINLVPGQGLKEGREGFGRRGVVQVWDVTTGQQVYTLRNAGQRAAYSPDGKQIVSVGFDQARFWDTESGQEVFNFNAQNRGVDFVTFSPDGEQMLVATSNQLLDPNQWSSIPGWVRVYPAPVRQASTTLRQHLAVVRKIEFVSDGREILSDGEDGVRLWKNPSGMADNDGQPLAEVISHKSRVNATSYHAASGRLAMALVDSFDETPGGVAIWDLPTARQIMELPDYKGNMTALAFSPDGKILITGRSFSIGNTGKALKQPLVTVWNAETYQPIRTFDGHDLKQDSCNVDGIVFDPEGKRTASSGTMPTERGQLQIGVLVWEHETGKVLLRLPGQSNPVFSPDGKFLATTGEKQLALWNLSTGAEHCELGPPVKHVSQIAFRPDGRCVAGIVEGVVMVWDLPTQRLLLDFREICLPVGGEDRFRNQRYNEASEVATAVSFSPDGKRLVVGLRNGTIKVWPLPLMESESGEPIIRCAIGMDNYLDMMSAAEYRKARILAAGGCPAAERSYTSARELALVLARDFPENKAFATHLGRIDRESASYWRATGNNERADAAAAAAQSQWKKLGGEDSLEDRSSATLAATARIIANTARTRGDHELARDISTGLVNILEAMWKENATQPRLREQLIDAHGTRAVALVELKSYKEALPDWERALELAGGKDPTIRLGRAVTMGRAGDHAHATAEAEALALPNTQPITRFGLARIFARSVSTVRDDQQLTQEERDKLAERHSARAMELLKAAQAGGVFKDSLYIDRIRRDKELDALRGREDFKQLLEEVTRVPGP